MTLGEHFREFRRRLFIAAASVLVASIVAGIFYDRSSRSCRSRSTTTGARTRRARQPQLR